MQLNQRGRHNPFRAQALITVVVTLNDDFRGGLYVSTGGERDRTVLPLGRGDAIVHQADLLHGVEIADDGGERWSWIIWYRDHERCQLHSHEWSEQGARAGDPVAMYLHAQRLSSAPGMSLAEHHRRRVFWLRRSAHGGFSQAMFSLSSPDLARNPAETKRWLKRAIAVANDSQACLQYARILQQEVGSAAVTSPGRDGEGLSEWLQLYLRAAEGGLAKAMHIVGGALIKGLGGATRDPIAAVRWLEEAGTKDSLIEAARQHELAGRFGDALRSLTRSAERGSSLAKQILLRGYAGSNSNAPRPRA